MYLENINDTVHPMSTHESAVDAAAEALWQRPARRRAQADGDGADPAVRLRLRLLRPAWAGASSPNGHSVLGIHFSIHSGYAQLPDYEAAMREAHGAERAAEILQRSPQNAVLLSEPGA